MFAKHIAIYIYRIAIERLSGKVRFILDRKSHSGEMRDEKRQDEERRVLPRSWLMPFLYPSSLVLRFGVVVPRDGQQPATSYDEGTRLFEIPPRGRKRSQSRETGLACVLYTLHSLNYPRNIDLIPYTRMQLFDALIRISGIGNHFQHRYRHRLPDVFHNYSI